MPTGDANRVALRYFKEVSYGTVTGNPKFTDLRFVSESFGSDNTFVRTETIRSDRQSDDVIRVEVGASGGFDFELAAKEYDPFYEALFASAGFSSEVLQAVTGTPNITFAFSAGQSTITRSAGSWVTDLGVANAAALTGIWLIGFGWAQGANNNIYKIGTGSSATVLNINCHVPLVAEGPTAASPTKNFTKMSQIVGPGTTITSFAFEKQYTDLTNVYEAHAGQVPETHKITMEVGKVITGNFSFLGAIGATASATLGDGSPNPVQTTKFMNTVDHLVAVINGISSFPISTALDATKFELNFKTNARQRRKMGTIIVDSIGLGEMEVSGSVEIFFTTNPVAYTKSFDFTTGGIATIVRDSVGNIFVWDQPSIKYTKGRRVAGKKNTDVVIALDFEAFRDSVEGITCRLARKQI